MSHRVLSPDTTLQVVDSRLSAAIGVIVNFRATAIAQAIAPKVDQLGNMYSAQ